MERKRMTSAEQKDFVNLCAAESLLKADALAKRIDALDECGEKLRQASEGLNDVLCGLMDTMPYEQLASYHKQIQHIAIAVGVKNAGNYDDWDGRYLKFSEINVLLDGCQDHCLMCDMMPITMKQCPIRKLYNTIPADSLCTPLACDE